MSNLKLSDIEIVYRENKDFIKTFINTSDAIGYAEIIIPGDKNLHMYFNYGKLIYKGEFEPIHHDVNLTANLLCQFSFYFTEMLALQGSIETEKVWRYYECYGGFQALEFALIQSGMLQEDLNNWKVLLKQKAL